MAGLPRLDRRAEPADRRLWDGSRTVLALARPDPSSGAQLGVGLHGLDRDAAPGYLLRLGAEPEVRLIALALARGWAVVVSDGEGLGMPGPHTYGAGRSGGHALLDVARAGAGCGADLSAHAPVLLWGYSEGGRCAAWAAELQPTYAPELDLLAVAAGGVPGDLRAVATAIDAGPFSGLGLAVLVGLAHAYRDRRLWAILSSRGMAAAAHAATLDVAGLVSGHPEPIRGHTVRDDPWDEPVWREVLERERNGRFRPGAATYRYHVVGDQLVPTAVGRALYRDYADLGADVTWTDVHAEGHVVGALVGAADAVGWLAERVDLWDDAVHRVRMVPNA